jgi:hypothetical protein
MPLGLERRLLYVTEILAVDMQGQWNVAANLDPVEVVTA